MNVKRPLQLTCTSDRHSRKLAIEESRDIWAADRKKVMFATGGSFARWLPS